MEERSVSFFKKMLLRLVTDADNLGHLSDHLQRLLQVLPRVCRRDAEADAGLNQGRGRVSHHHHRQPTLQALPRERGHLRRVVQQSRDHRRRNVAVNCQPHLNQPLPEEGRVLRDAAQSLLAPRRPVAPHDHLEGRQRLLRAGRRQRRARHDASRAPLQALHRLAVRSDVAADAAERLRVRAHEQVHVVGVHAAVLDDAASGGPDGADGVGLVDVEQAVVLLLELDDPLQVDDLALHAVDALAHDDNLLPRLVRPRLPLPDGPTDHGLQVGEVVVPEHERLRSGAAGAGDERRVVEAVRDEQGPRGGEDGQRRRVRREAHGHDDRGLLPDELRRQLLQLRERRRVAGVGGRAAGGGTEGAHALLHGVQDVVRVLREAEVVVAREVHAADRLPGEVEGQVVVLRRALHHAHLRPGARVDGAVPAVADAVVEAARVEVVEVAQQGRVAGGRGAAGRRHQLAEELPEVAHGHEHAVAEVRGEGDPKGDLAVLVELRVLLALRRLRRFGGDGCLRGFLRRRHLFEGLFVLFCCFILQ
eukprot:Rhum_TRINITY_DN14689_c1_g2::Rhum_TRINITY_DN14689_c1_g2_i1::g.109791::m.109791